MTEVKVYKFTLHNNNLTDRLLKNSPASYEWLKVTNWLNTIYDEYGYVVKWNKPTGRGTSWKCKPIESKEQLDEELAKVHEYVEDVNNRLKTKFTLNKEVKKDTDGVSKESE